MSFLCCRGRLSRSGYWLTMYVLFAGLVAVLRQIGDRSDLLPVVLAVVSFVYYSATVRRMHDVGWSGSSLLIFST
jgi:uncharacterized membrane protein YhaH (DUF805 family)